MLGLSRPNKCKGLGRIFRATGAIILIIVGTLFFTIASVENSLWIIALFVSLGVACLVGVLATVRIEIRRPSPAKLVKVVRANFRQGWMDVRFGNREYARLVGDLNQQRADSPTFWNDPAGSKKEIPEALRESRSREKARERRIVGNLKPFRWNPAGNQSRPVEPDQQPEASLAWWVGDHPCEA